jgi:hypothetical protein
MAETNGVKYLKINRLDANGDDCSPKIQIADNIRINYSDVGSVLYDILTIQQQADYYLIGIIPQPTTSSNPGGFGFSLKASASYNINNLSATPTWDGSSDNSFFFNIGSGSSVNNSQGDALAFYETGSSGSGFGAAPTKYTFRTVPNEILNIQFTCSIKNDNNINAPFTASLYIIGAGTGPPFYIPIAQSLIPLNTTLSFSGSINTLSSGLNASIRSGSYFFIQGFGTLGIGRLTASFAELNITALPMSNVSTLLNFSPEIVNFYNTDDNALLNNATLPKYSTIYQDIDYSTGLVPTNFKLLASGNADYAPIQDSNYTATGWSNSRYKGTKIWSTDFNI